MAGSKCEHCDHKSKNKTMLKTHILNNHKTQEEREREREKNFKYYCKMCDFGTFAINTLNVHYNTKKHKQAESYNKK